MKVRIGDFWFDSAELPIQVILSEEERNELINDAAPNEHGVCNHAFVPTDVLGWSEEDVRHWLEGRKTAFASNDQHHKDKEAKGEIGVFVVSDDIHVGKTMVATNLARGLLMSGFSNVRLVSAEGDVKFRLLDEHAKAYGLRTIPRITIYDQNQRFHTPLSDKSSRAEPVA